MRYCGRQSGATAMAVPPSLLPSHTPNYEGFAKSPRFSGCEGEGTAVPIERFPLFSSLSAPPTGSQSTQDTQESGTQRRASFLPTTRRLDLIVCLSHLSSAETSRNKHSVMK